MKPKRLQKALLYCSSFFMLLTSSGWTSHAEIELPELGFEFILLLKNMN
jgi:hypothetical protein